eukprot:CAMPEP_0175592114 /NCGR_PEP_ID=MMETSP0096-20121207/53226_1 /TAXON_ID=311494 /ORGANISM="Alexandrium monilatum, Strain CCMP3105" /LENGTH=56 /DNA_ID=CAMNT_0016896289 /DNA_START=104 /DNA_END=271 /DNA_ORIENTATION=-
MSGSVPSCLMPAMRCKAQDHSWPFSQPLIAALHAVASGVRPRQRMSPSNRSPRAHC